MKIYVATLHESMPSAACVIKYVDFIQALDDFPSIRP
jgi:hypothetical protein